MTAVDLIVAHHPGKWRHTATGQTHSVVWVCPHEVASISDDGTWLGRPSLFIQEFESEPNE